MTDTVVTHAESGYHVSVPGSRAEPETIKQVVGCERSRKITGLRKAVLRGNTGVGPLPGTR